jgi:chemotaxis signal transduction protein
VSADLQAILDQRARQLAGPGAGAATAPTVEVLVAVAGGARYGFETRHVREVVRLAEMRRLPAGSAWLRGLVPARGEVVPVGDLAELLGLPASDAGHRYAVVIDGPAPPVGLLVDEASDVVDVPADLLSPRDDDGRSASLELGVAADGTVVLDALSILRDQRLVVPRRSPGSSPSHPRQES